MGFQKPEKKQEGTKILLFGEAGSGKTPTGLSFPDIALVDSDSGTNFYDLDNVVVNSSTLSFKELKSDLDELEMDDELFSQIKTFTIDSISRFHENMQHAMVKVAENRAKANGRDAEAEGLSFREYGKMKLYYDEFFARMMTYAKQGKHIVFVAEQKDKSENVNGEVRKVGVIPNSQKDIEFDFDIVVRTYKDKDGNPKGEIIKDRTGTFKAKQIIDKPHYDLWKDAIEKNLQGKARSKEEIKSMTESINEEMTELDDGESLQKEVLELIKTLNASKKEEAKQLLTEKVGTVKVGTLTDTSKLKEALQIVKQLHAK
jgi:AAA domain